MDESTPLCVMISGAGRGIGQVITRHLASQGYRLSLCSRHPDQIRAALGDRWDDTRMLALECNVRRTASLDQWLEATLAHFGTVDALVNNAGVGMVELLANTTEAQFDYMINSNLRCIWYLARQLLPHFHKRQTGYFIQIASIVGKHPAYGESLYGMTKAAVIALSEALLLENWHYGIRSTALCPGWVNTETVKDVLDIPAESVVQPLDVAKTVDFLLSLQPTTLVRSIDLFDQQGLTTGYNHCLHTYLERSRPNDSV